MKEIFLKLRKVLETGESLRKKVIIGSFWLYLIEVLSRGLVIVQTIVLARLLAPEHFGIIGVFYVVSAALERFTITGFNKALIQRKSIDNDYLNTAWTISIVRGIILYLLLFLCSPAMVGFLNAPNALSVVRVLGLILLMQGFYNIGTIYFSKDLNFCKQFLWKTSAVVANFAVSIPLAFILRNEWAIVWGLLASEVTSLTFSYILHSYRPKLKFDLSIFKQLFGYGKWLLLSSIIVFFSKQGDKIFVTRLLGEVGLGIYVIAWRFARIPELLTNPLPNALFPAYSKFQDNPMYVKEKYIEMLRVISLFFIPLVAGIIVLAGPFITICLGEKWASATLPMQILTLATGINIITFTSLSLFNAMGKTNVNFIVNCVKLLTMAIFVYPLISHYNVVGAALCYLAMSISGFVIWKYEIYKLIRFTIKDLNCLLLPAINTAFVVFAVVYYNFIISIDNAVSFIGAICVGIITYIIIGLIISKLMRFNYFGDVMQMASLLKPRRI